MMKLGKILDDIVGLVSKFHDRMSAGDTLLDAMKDVMAGNDEND